MIGIIDYGLGNVQSFVNIYKSLHIPVQAIKTTADLESSTKLILPGVGHFDYAMQKFEDSGLKSQVEDLVLNNSIPILGVCVGMQLMANSSEEGTKSGLGWIGGTVKKLNAKSENGTVIPLPHLGWNKIEMEDISLFNELKKEELEFYFLHSYYFDCEDKKNCIAQTNYFSKFCCAVNKHNIFGVQFHPEKSHNFGIKLLENFSSLY